MLLQWMLISWFRVPQSQVSGFVEMNYAVVLLGWQAQVATRRRPLRRLKASVAVAPP